MTYDDQFRATCAAVRVEYAHYAGTPIRVRGEA